MGRFAVMEHNMKTGEKLILKRVVNGVMQEKSAKIFGIELMGETLYYLALEAQNTNGIISTYKAVVFQFYLNGRLEKFLFDLILDCA